MAISDDGIKRPKGRSDSYSHLNISDPDMLDFLREFFRAGLKMQDLYADALGVSVPEINRIGNIVMIPDFYLTKPGIEFHLDLGRTDSHGRSDPAYVFARGSETPQVAPFSFLKRMAGELNDTMASICSSALNDQLEDIIEELEGIEQYDAPAEKGFFYSVPAKAAQWLSLLPTGGEKGSGPVRASANAGSLSMVVFGRMLDQHVVDHFTDLMGMGEFSHYFVVPTVTFAKRVDPAKIPEEFHKLRYWREGRFTGELPEHLKRYELFREGDRYVLKTRRTVPFLIDFGNDQLIAECRRCIAEEANRQKASEGDDAVAVRLEQMLTSPDEDSKRVIKDVYESSMLWLRVHALYGEGSKILATPAQIVSMFPEKGRIALQAENTQDYDFLDGITKELITIAERKGHRSYFTTQSIRTNGLEVVCIGDNTLDALERPRYRWLKTQEGLKWLDTQDGCSYLKSPRGQKWLDSKAGNWWKEQTPAGQRYSEYTRTKTAKIPLFDPSKAG
ncbi:TPA: hypothetical protein HA265_04815 [Candidatus Woesearchaeota archaeon]|nr:hypothetical protein [Candidatus Woesearchaeota archaeon]